LSADDARLVRVTLVFDVVAKEVGRDYSDCRKKSTISCKIMITGVESG
jgi:hypothetical protein